MYYGRWREYQESKMADVASSRKLAQSSLVTDVLQKTGHLEQEDFHACVKQMLQKAEEVKAEVFQAIYKEYSFGAFQDLNSSTYELDWKVKNLLKDIDNASKRIKGSIHPQLDVAATEHSKLTQELHDTEVIAQVLTRLCKIRTALDRFPSEMNSEEYCKAAEIITAVNEDLSRIPKAGQESKIVIVLREETRRQHSQLVNKLESVWSKSASWNTPTSASLDSIHVHLKTKLTFTTVESGMENVIYAMQTLDVLHKKIRTFGEKLLKYFLRPMTVFPSLKPSIDKTKQAVVISLVKDSTRQKVLDPGKVYVKITEVLDVIKNHFHPDIEEEKTEKPVDENKKSVQLFFLLGSVLWPVLSEDIIKDCLAKSVPNTSAQLEKYQEVIANTEEFEYKLNMLGFLQETPSVLSKYVKDISVHFGNKKCQDLLVAARDLMKDDIHNTIAIDKYSDTAVLRSLGEIENAVSGKKEKKGSSSLPVMNEADKVSPFTFQLPSCRISESTKMLMNLAYRTLVEATKSTPQSAIQLFYTVRNMFELFCSVVPTYHQENLATLPQLAALHHNNCMYISHLLMTMGHQFKSQLPEPLNQGAATFMDLVPTIRSLGENCLLEQLRRQRSQLLNIIRDADGLADAHEDARGDKIERAIQQVLHQLFHLKKMWLGILPHNLFHQSLGALLDAVLMDIIEKVLQLEDISSDEATRLHSILSILINRGPEIFLERTKGKDQSQVDPHTAVPHWSKYKQMVGALEASLQELADGWSDGKGPLALDFTANEVRGLIRALFQNTDRRAAVLAKIKAVQ